MKARPAFAMALLLCSAGAFAASAFLEKGSLLFLANKPAEARPLLEQALTDDPADETVYLYLGIVYQQLGDADRAIAVLKRGLNVSTQYKDLFLFNIGNNFFAKKQYTFAEESYTAAVSANKNLAAGYLNRANSRLSLESYEGALADYTLYLQLAPSNPQRPQIEEVIRLLQKLLADQEAQLAAELERQKALMNDVLSSLTNASDDARNLRVENLTITDDTEDVDIQD